jgi:hypothetical protein
MFVFLLPTEPRAGPQYQQNNYQQQILYASNSRYRTPAKEGKVANNRHNWNITGRQKQLSHIRWKNHEKSLTQAKGRVTVTAKTINSGYRKLATAGTILQQKRGKVANNTTNWNIR